MNVGILSMQRVYNYGSFLQAYALKKIFNHRGHEVGFVDIEKGNVVKQKDDSRIKKIIKHIDRYLIKRVLYSKKNKELDQLFYNVQKNILNLSDDYMKAEQYDAVVIGSDEIFVCDPKGQWGLTGQRFGKIEVTKVLSYAASCGYTGIMDIPENKITEIKNGLENLVGISVRDRNTSEFVEKMVGIIPEVNLDPVLIYDFKNEILLGEEMGIPQCPYMVVYAYHNRINAKNEIYEIKKYAKEKGLKTICIGGSLPWCDSFEVLHPFQVLAYFKHADCIVTDTFHGSVMAAKLNKKFAVLVRDSNKNKLGHLLEKLCLQDRSVEDIEKIGNILNRRGDFNTCNKIIDNEIKHTMNYFENCGL